MIRAFKLICFLFLYLGCSDNIKRTKSAKSDNNIQVQLLEIDDQNLTLNQKLNKVNELFGLSKKSNDSILLAIILKKGNLHYKLKQYDSTAYYDRLLFQKSNSLNNNFFNARAAKNIALTLKKEEIFDSAYVYFNKAKNIFQNLQDSLQTSRVLMSMAQIQHMQGDYVGSKETATTAISFINKSKNEKYTSLLNNTLAMNYRKLFNFDDAIFYYKLAIKQTPAKSERLLFQNNLATAYIDQKAYNKAITILQQTIADTILQHTPKQYARVLDNLAYAQWLHTKTNPLPSFLKALGIRQKINERRGQVASYLHLGEFYLNTNKQKSYQYLMQANAITKQLKMPDVELESLQFLMKLHPKDITLKDRYIFLKDSLYKQELKAKTFFAKLKYDDELRLEQITALEKEKEIKQLELNKQKNQKTIALLLIVLGIISTAFLLFYLKQQHKKEKLKEVYATETRISKKVHDELANDVYNIINRLENEPKTTVVLNQLEAVYKKTRDISYENSSINLEPNYFYLELKELINSYQSTSTSVLVKGLSKTIWQNISNDKKIVVERVLKELMINMKKHSKATAVLISFKRESKKLIITYSDNGIGITNTENFKNNGLKNVENRIKNINGTLNFDFEKNKGIQITFSFPT